MLSTLSKTVAFNTSAQIYITRLQNEIKYANNSHKIYAISFSILVKLVTLYNKVSFVNIS